jgi:hypothetical protein
MLQRRHAPVRSVPVHRQRAMCRRTVLREWRVWSLPHDRWLSVERGLQGRAVLRRWSMRRVPVHQLGPVRDRAGVLRVLTDTAHRSAHGHDLENARPLRPGQLDLVAHARAQQEGAERALRRERQHGLAAVGQRDAAARRHHQVGRALALVRNLDQRPALRPVRSGRSLRGPW